MEHHKQDTDTQVFFYEQEFYVLSNFSAFQINWSGKEYPTSEHLYQAMKFVDLEATSDYRVRSLVTACELIRNARSAHQAFKLAEDMRHLVRADWKEVRVGVMKEILHAKANQHEYVRRKLLETGDRELVEDSWRDGFWGWGKDGSGENMLGKLWMEIREDLRNSILQSKQEDVWAVTE